MDVVQVRERLRAETPNPADARARPLVPAASGVLGEVGASIPDRLHRVAGTVANDLDGITGTVADDLDGVAVEIARSPGERGGLGALLAAPGRWRRWRGLGRIRHQVIVARVRRR
jgi:hypothetical protein